MKFNKKELELILDSLSESLDNMNVDPDEDERAKEIYELINKIEETI